MIHIRCWTEDPHYVPMCGSANWDRLVREDDPDNECWECASIAGVEQPFERRPE